MLYSIYTTEHFQRISYIQFVENLINTALNMSLDKFEFIAKKYHCIFNRLPHGLHSHSAVLYDGKLLLSGGLDVDGKILQQFYVYDWNQIEG